ncbi:hypothetical protein Tco_0685108 [Tanacetum coccineum]
MFDKLLVLRVRKIKSHVAPLALYSVLNDEEEEEEEDVNMYDETAKLSTKTVGSSPFTAVVGGLWKVSMLVVPVMIVIPFGECDAGKKVHQRSHHGSDGYDSLKRNLGMVRTLFFWDDIWSGEVPLKSKFPRLYALEESKDISVASKMGLPSLLHSFRRHPRGGVESAQFRDLCDITSDVLLTQMQDRWSWSLNASGVFLVSSVRNFIDDAILPKKDAPTRWVKLVPIKINILS